MQREKTKIFAFVGDRKMTTEQRTQVIIEKYRGNKHEFQMLKGILCMNHGWDIEDDVKLYALIDNTMIAERLDEINRIAIIKNRL